MKQQQKQTGITVFYSYAQADQAVRVVLLSGVWLQHENHTVHAMAGRGEAGVVLGARQRMTIAGTWHGGAVIHWIGDAIAGLRLG